MLRARMSWEEVEGGVFLEELKDSPCLGLLPHPTPALLLCPRGSGFYIHTKLFHPRVLNAPACAGPSGGDPHPRLYLMHNKRNFFPFPFPYISFLVAQHRCRSTRGLLPWNSLIPAFLMPSVAFQEPGCPSGTKPHQGRSNPSPV